MGGAGCRAHHPPRNIARRCRERCRFHLGSGGRVRLAGSLLGRAVLVTGASGGGLGHLLVQLAHAAGAQVTAVARSERAAWLRKLGAAAVIGAEVLEGSTERFTVVFETVGGRTFSSALRVSEPEGLIVLLSSTSDEDARFQIYDFFGHEGVRLQSVFMYTRPERLGGALTELVGLVARGKLRPYVGLSTPWSDLPQVTQALGERTFQGKAVLTIPQTSPL